jgi:chromosome segregation ATPase
MEIDELEKRLNWLDSERQKDKKLISELSDLLASIKEDYAKQDGRITSVDLELKSIKKTASRAEKVDADFAAYKTEVMKQIVESEKKINISETKLDKQIKDNFDQINKKLLEYQTDVKIVAELKKNMQQRIEEELRLSQKVDEVVKSQAELKNMDADLQRQQHSVTNDLTTENKRITDMQLETSTKHYRSAQRIDPQARITIDGCSKYRSGKKTESSRFY